MRLANHPGRVSIGGISNRLLTPALSSVEEEREKAFAGVWIFESSNIRCFAAPSPLHGERAGVRGEMSLSTATTANTRQHCSMKIKTSYLLFVILILAYTIR